MIRKILKRKSKPINPRLFELQNKEWHSSQHNDKIFTVDGIKYRRTM